VTISRGIREVCYPHAFQPRGTKRMPAQLVGATEGEHLQVEAGPGGIGPSYNLSLAASGTALRPWVGTGPYGSAEDALGTSWVSPLLLYRRATPAEITEYQAYESRRRA
jgi:hypothetical protein